MEKLSVQNQLEIIKARKPKTKARTFVQEIAEQYEPFIVWINEKFFDDRRTYYIHVNRYFNHHGLYKLKEKLEYIKKVNNMAPLQVFELLK